MDNSEKEPFLSADGTHNADPPSYETPKPAHHHRRQAPWRMLVTRISMLSAVLPLMGMSSLVTYYCTIHRTAHPLGSFDKGYSTEFASVKPHLRLNTQIPSGDIHFAQSGIYMLNDSLATKLSGTSPETDKLWEDASLHHRHWFLLTDEEAEEAWGPSYTQYWNEARGGYYATLDAFHTIHCLDAARRAVHREAYEGDVQMGGAHHIAHCLAILLQSLKCKADTTLIPTTYRPAIGFNYLMPEQPHTCRDISKIEDYVLRRVPGGDLEVAPRERGPRDGIGGDLNYITREGAHREGVK